MNLWCEKAKTYIWTLLLFSCNHQMEDKVRGRSKLDLDLFQTYKLVSRGLIIKSKGTLKKPKMKFRSKCTMNFVDVFHPWNRLWSILIISLILSFICCKQEDKKEVKMYVFATRSTDLFTFNWHFIIYNLYFRSIWTSFCYFVL